MVATISTVSLEYVRVTVSAKTSGADVDPTGDTVAMAFLAAAATPAAGDWKSASWETDTTTSPDTYYARCNVGPGGAVTLTAGTYIVWVKVTDSPEIPARPAGLLKVI